jgi:hypothetical protein
VAVVSGGHGAVVPLTEWVEATPPPATSWARVISRLLELPAVGGIPRLASPGGIPG